ncbi:MAG: glycosyltransferase family 39 protein [Rhodoferax sp.]
MRWVLALAALHLALGAAVGLSVDEAHYLLYAAHPDWSYFDHPPLVGWVQWPLLALGLPDALLRLLPAVVWAATVLGVHRLTLRLFAAQPQAALAARTSVALLLLAPLLHVLGIGLLPDTLLMLWVVALMHQTWSLMDATQVARWAPWLRLGLLLGLAGLSKYTAIFPALAVALCLLAVHGAGLLRRAQPWAAVVLGLLLVLPVGVWNAQHGWASFAYQTQHGAGSAWRAMEVLRFALVQLLAYGPLMLALLLGWWRAPGRVRWMGTFFALPFAVLAYLAGGGSSLPHWTAPAWVAGAPLAAWGVVVWWQGARWQRALVAGLGALQALACAGLLGLMLSGGWPLLPQSLQPQPEGANPFADLHGWEQAGRHARALAQREGAESVAVQNWTLASRLGWYARPLPVRVLASGRSQFDYWSTPLGAQERVLLVDWSYLSYTVPRTPQGFARCDALEPLPVRHWGQDLGLFRFYRCEGWSGTPEPHLTLAP